MCGIAGFSGRGSRNILEQMTRTLSYRGPDGEGYYFNEQDSVGLGHRRLSIIDLGGGAQPIFNEDKSIAVIFNGEIYNFLDLRKDLESRHKFLTHSDTEVIAHLYEEKGEAVFEKLNGMFAIAIYDSRKKKLILARDRIGKKPLYWGVFENTLLFGSELKALQNHPFFKKEIDLESLNKYLIYEYVPTPRSIWKNVYKLEPGTSLSWQNNQVKKRNFWKPNFNQAPISFEEAKKELDKQINDSVSRRLVSDVPIGIFLSGGIDSATISYYAQKNSDRPMETFSIGFKDKSFDESSYARKIAAFLGTSHFEHIFSPKDMHACMPEVFNLLDEPLADASLIPTFLLSQFTRKRVTVALGGDGGDELFAGYPTFQADRLASIYEKLPFFARKEVIERCIKNLPVSHGNFSFDFQAKKFIEGFDVDKKYRHQRWLGSFGKSERAGLLRQDIWENLSSKNEYEEVDVYLEEAKSAGKENASLYMYLRTYLMDEVLVKVDRASMYNALETRSPFLDYHLVDFVNSLPYHFKYRGWTTKYILKELMRDKIPEEIIQRPKKGFGIPLADWLRNDLRDFVEETLSDSKVERAGFFNPGYVRRLKDEHFSFKKDNRKLLWNLMVFQMWQEKWYK